LFQRGQGIGGFLASLFKSCLPILRSRGLALSKTLLNTGMDMMGDMQDNVSLRTSFNNRKNETLSKLKNNVITGNGYKNTRKKKLSHSTTSRRVNNVVAKKRKKSTTKRKKTKTQQKKTLKKKFRDIFS
jgi:hypothetical protein